MRKRTAKRIRRAGPTSHLLARAPFLFGPVAAQILADVNGRSRHGDWACAIAEKFSARADRRGTPRPSLVDLALRERLTILSKYINRPMHLHHHQAVHNVLRNTVVQQLFPGIKGGREFSGKEAPDGRNRA